MWNITFLNAKIQVTRERKIFTKPGWRLLWISAQKKKTKYRFYIQIGICSQSYFQITAGPTHFHPPQRQKQYIKSLAKGLLEPQKSDLLWKAWYPAFHWLLYGSWPKWLIWVGIISYSSVTFKKKKGSYCVSEQMKWFNNAQNLSRMQIKILSYSIWTQNQHTDQRKCSLKEILSGIR